MLPGAIGMQGTVLYGVYSALRSVQCSTECLVFICDTTNNVIVIYNTHFEE